MPTVNRTYNAWTTRLLAEWIAINLPRASVQNEVKLGPIDTPSVPLDQLGVAVGVAKNKRARIDALAWDATTIYLIEAKPLLNGAALGQIEHYLRLLPATPELQSLMGRQVKGILLVPNDDSAVHVEANLRGIEVAVYKPQWWDATVAKVQAQQAEAIAQLEPRAAGTGRAKIRQNIFPENSRGG